MRPAFLGALGLLATASALAQSTQTVYINGVAVQATATQQGGETYYRFRAGDLKRIGALTAGGVTPKTDAIRGCVGDTLFNGVYSVQLQGVGVVDGRWTATLVLKNASAKPLWSYMVFDPSDVSVADGAGKSVAMSNYVGGWVKDAVPPGTQTRLQPTVAPGPYQRLLIRPGADSLKELNQAKLPLAKIYNMEFDLTCKK